MIKGETGGVTKSFGAEGDVDMRFCADRLGWIVCTPPSTPYSRAGGVVSGEEATIGAARARGDVTELGVDARLYPGRDEPWYAARWPGGLGVGVADTGIGETMGITGVGIGEAATGVGSGVGSEVSVSRPKSYSEVVLAASSLSSAIASSSRSACGSSASWATAISYLSSHSCRIFFE